MSGVLNALVASGPFSTAVNIGNSGTLFGFSDGSQTAAFGSLTGPAQFRGAQIQVCAHQTSGGGTFSVVLAGGSLPQSFFTRITVQRTDGSFFSFLSSSSTGFTHPGGTSTSWAFSTFVVWTSTSPSPRLVTIW